MLVQPYPEDEMRQAEPLIQFYCLDASLAIKPVFEKFANVILTSGTISPLEIYPKILQFTPKLSRAFSAELPRNAIQPLVITKGPDMVQVSSKFDERENVGVVRNYGNLLLELS